MAFQTPLGGTASAEAVRRGGACVFWSSLARLKPGVGVGGGDALEAAGAFSRVAGLLFAFRSLPWCLHTDD